MSDKSKDDRIRMPELPEDEAAPNGELDDVSTGPPGELDPDRVEHIVYIHVACQEVAFELHEMPKDDQGVLDALKYQKKGLVAGGEAIYCDHCGGCIPVYNLRHVHVLT